MGEETKISWTATDGKPGATFNPWMGCERISEGCKHCYAETFVSRRMGLPLWGPARSTERQRTSLENWKKPLTWNRTAQREGRRIKVFCASLADVFEDNPQVAPWRADLFRLIEQTTYLDWLILTKRTSRMAALAREAGWSGAWPSNVWAGTTVENQDMANKRIPCLLGVPARVRFLSCEPLLEAVDLTAIPRTQAEGFMRPLDGRFNTVSWVICGGESGPGARPFDLTWARSLRDQCRAADVPFFMKQIGRKPRTRLDANESWPGHNAGHGSVQFVGDGFGNYDVTGIKDKAGADMNEWPEDLRVQEFPR